MLLTLLDTRRRRRAKDELLCKLKTHRRRYPLNYSIGFPRVPTAIQLVATGY